MENQVMTPYTMNQVLLGIKTQLATVAAGKVHLFQNDMVPTTASIIADFTEATYDGYAALSTPYGGGPYRETDGSFTIESSLSFSMTGSVTPNIIYGAYQLDSTGANLIFAKRFDNPIAMVDAFSHILIVNKITLPVNGLVNGAIVSP
jgi:hypothetical protein